MTKFRDRVRKAKTDEWYSYENTVELIVPYLKRAGYQHVWCPFDTRESNYVKVLKKAGFEVTWGHIDTGQDFLEYKTIPEGVEVIVSNPPFSLRNDIFTKVYNLRVPFALLMNSNGLFDARIRYDLFKGEGVELLIPRGRMKFFEEDRARRDSPSFQSIYVCKGVLEEQLVLDNSINF